MTGVATIYCSRPSACMSFVFRHGSWGFTPGYGNCRLSACTEHAESVPYHIAQGNALGQSTQRRMHTLKGCHLMLATAITTICRGYATEVDTPVILLRLLIRSHIFIFKPIFDTSERISSKKYKNLISVHLWFHTRFCLIITTVSDLLNRSGQDFYRPTPPQLAFLMHSILLPLK